MDVVVICLKAVGRREGIDYYRDIFGSGFIPVHHFGIDYNSSKA